MADKQGKWISHDHYLNESGVGAKSGKSLPEVYVRSGRLYSEQNTIWDTEMVIYITTNELWAIHKMNRYNRIQRTTTGDSNVSEYLEGVIDVERITQRLGKIKKIF